MMDEVSGGRRSVNKASKSSGLLLKETAGRRSEPCSKLGCGSRLNNTSRGQIGFSQKAKYMRSSSIRSTCTAGKEVASRNNNSAAINCNLNKGASHITEHSSSSSSSFTTSSEELGVTEMEVVENASSLDSSGQGDGSSSSVKSKRSCRSSSAAASSVSVVPRKLKVAANVGNQSRLNSLKCNSMSDAVAPVPSSNRSRVNSKRKDVAVKSSRNFEGETSSSRAKKKMVAVSSPNPPRRSGFSVPTGRLSRSETVQGRRPPPSSSASSSSLHAREKSCTSPIIPSDGDVLNPSLLGLSTESSIFNRTRHLGGLSSRAGSSSPTSSLGNTDTSRPFLLQQYSSLEEGIAEMVAAFERIERRNGRGRLDYEQFLASGFLVELATTFDQHREMRMDIDNMSYEELLALEERIGTVSTALPEESLSKCLETDLYPTAPHSCNGSKFIRSAEKNDDTKCSICQEDYSSGEEIGRLQCKHMYHSDCITQWLGLKNWCPICKASVESSSSSTSTHGNNVTVR